jgi:hypothetical protein
VKRRAARSNAPAIRPGPGYSLPALRPTRRMRTKGMGREARSVWEAPVMAAEMLEKTVSAIGKRYLEHAEKRARTIATLRERVALLEAQCTNWERVDQEHRVTIVRLEKSLVGAKDLLENWSARFAEFERKADGLSPEAGAELTKPAKVGTDSPIGEATRKNGKPHRGKGHAVDLMGTKVGTFVVVEKAAERYFGQAVWLLRCPDCGAELRWYSQKVRRSHRAPLCKCADVPAEAIGKRSTGPGAPSANESAARKPSIPITMTRQKGHDLTGVTLGTFRAVGKTNERRLGQIVWMFRCSECGAERLWSPFNVNSIRKKSPNFKCECQGGSKPQSTGRVPGMRLESTPPLLNDDKPLDELTADELEAATLAEFERDRSLPLFRSEAEDRRDSGSLLDDPSDDENDEEAVDFDLAAGDEDD